MFSCARVLTIILALVAPATFAAAQNYPNRTVKIVVPFGAGGPGDIFARQLAQYLSDQLKQSFIIENRPGAGSIIGTDIGSQ